MILFCIDLEQMISVLSFFRLIKEKKNRPHPDTEMVPQQKKRENSKILKLCYFGINESLGDTFTYPRNKMKNDKNDKA